MNVTIAYMRYYNYSKLIVNLICQQSENCPTLDNFMGNGSSHISFIGIKNGSKGYVCVANYYNLNSTLPGVSNYSNGYTCSISASPIASVLNLTKNYTFPYLVLPRNSSPIYYNGTSSSTFGTCLKI